MAGWSWKAGVVTLAVVAATAASTTCDDQYLEYLLKKANVDPSDVATCTEASGFAFNLPQVPASGQILVDLCANDKCTSILQALDAQLSGCNLPNCSATASMASWSIDSRSSSGSEDGSSEPTVGSNDAAATSGPTVTRGSAAGSNSNAGAAVGASAAALVASLAAAMLQ